jgi:O-antigen/teichoic acid export membrane protein
MREAHGSRVRGSSSLVSFPSRRRATITRLLFSYSSTAFVVINGIILVPYYLSFFDVATYGAWLASGNVVGLLGLLDGGLTPVTAQRMALRYGAGDTAGFVRAAGSGLALVATVAAVVSIAAFVLASWLPSWVKASPIQQNALASGIWMAGLGAGMSLVRNALAKIADAWQQTVFVGVESLVSLIAGVAAILIGLALGLGVASPGLGSLAQGVVGLVLEVTYIAISWRKKSLPRPTLERGEAVDLLHTTAPLFVGRLANSGLANSESLIVAVFINPVQSARLALTSRAYNVADLLISPIQGAAYSSLAHLAGSEPLDYQRKIGRELCELVGAISALIIGTAVAMNRGFLGLWVGTANYAGKPVDLAVCVATIVSTQLLLIAGLVMAFGRLVPAGWLALIGAVSRLMLIFTLLPTLDILGMPASAAGANLIVLGLSIAVLQRYLEIASWDMARMMLAEWIPLAVAVPIGIGMLSAIPDPATWWGFGVRTVLVGSAMAVIASSTSPALRTIIRRATKRATKLFAGAASR